LEDPQHGDEDASHTESGDCESHAERHPPTHARRKFAVHFEEEAGAVEELG